MDKVYLVEDCGNSPGKIYAVFKHQEDAEEFAEQTSYVSDTKVVERTVFIGQPRHLGYNQ